MEGRVRISVLGCVLLAVSLLATAVLALVIVASVPDRLGLLLSIVAASVPALVYAAIIIRLDRYEIEPRRVLVACVAWGAIGAILLSLIGEILFKAALVDSLGLEATALASVVLGAPLIEESAKGIAVLGFLIFARHELDDVLDGLVYGALVGVGFALTENIFYYGQSYLEDGPGELGVLFVARSIISGLGHPAYTAVTGAAIGWARSRHGRGVARFGVPVLGWAIAVLLHGLWNGGLVFTQLQWGDEVGLLQAVAVLIAVLVALPFAVRSMSVLLSDDQARTLYEFPSGQPLTGPASEDHANAKLIAAAIADTTGLALTPANVESNLIWFEAEKRLGSAREIAGRLREKGVLVSPLGEQTLRAVTHLDVNRTQCEQAAEVIRQALRL